MSNQNYLDSLNTVQKDAVTTLNGPVLVIAGPGSGKTRVLTYRIAHILQSGISADHILSLTFTNKAAKEMQERIHSVVGASANGIWAGTFHSLFSRILRMEAHHIGYPTSFTIYDTEDSKNVLSALIKELNLDKETYQVNQLRNRISAAKSALVTPTMYETNAEFLKQDKAAGRPMIAMLYRKYTERCKRAGAMDFDDLLYRLYELLQRNPDNILDKYRKKFKYVMVDEFQDTNHLQYAIIRKLVHFEGSTRNICVVGDDAQSIYSFRGATIQNILDFENDFKPFGIQVFKLEQNYRSSIAYDADDRNPFTRPIAFFKNLKTVCLQPLDLPVLACARLQRFAEHCLELLILRRTIKRRDIVRVKIQRFLLVLYIEILSDTDGFLAHPHAK